MRYTGILRFAAAAAFSVIASTGLVGGRAEAAVIDFETLADPGSGFYEVGMTYIEDGFRLTVADGALPFVTFGAAEARYGGSPALYNNNDEGVTRLTVDGGGTFSITRIDLAGDTRFGAIPVSFIGTRGDLSTIQFDLILNNSLLMAFAFPLTFTDLVKLEWSQIIPYHQFDNVIVEATPSTPAPEPAALLLMGTGVIAWVRRRRCHVADRDVS